MPKVPAGLSFGEAGHHREHELRPLHGLNLRPLIDAQDYRVVWRGHVEPDNIANLLHEERVIGELESEKLSDWCGLTVNALQTRPTVAWLSSSFSASDLVD